jgi:23S rRNA pseudouridine2605 synthase
MNYRVTSWCTRWTPCGSPRLLASNLTLPWGHYRTLSAVTLPVIPSPPQPFDELSHRMVRRPLGNRMIMIHKPRGQVVARYERNTTSIGDTIYTTLPSWFRDDGWVPVGRLDKDSEGLLLMIKGGRRRHGHDNGDGQLLERLNRPFKCNKLYYVTTSHVINNDHITRMMKGIRSDGQLLRAVNVRFATPTDLTSYHNAIMLPTNNNNNNANTGSQLLIELNEGKNRHIRRMIETLKPSSASLSAPSSAAEAEQQSSGTNPNAMNVTRLCRIQYATLKLDISSAQWRYLSPAECESLMRISGFDSWH